MALSLPRLRRVFTQIQSGGFRAINNSSGTWTNTGAKLLRAGENAFRITPNMPINPVPVLTGTRSMAPGVRGRRNASWSMQSVPVIPSGTAGTAPDMDHIFQNIFGQSGTVVASTSVTYSFLDTGFVPLTILDFLNGQSSNTQKLIWGAFVSQFVLEFNQNFMTCSANGFGGFTLDSDNFSSEDTTAKAGLTEYPTIPGSPTTAGNPIAGFGGSATFDSQSIEAKIRSMRITINTGFDMIGDVFSDAYGVQAVAGARRVSVQLGVVDDDSAALIDLKQKAKSATAPTINGSVTVGTVAGSRMTVNLNAIQLITPELADNSTYVMANFPEADAHATAVGNVDDCTIAFT